MKKLFIGFFLGMSLITIPSVSAIEEMTETVMRKTTGQASVSIRLDNVVIEDLRFSLLYIDDDGITGTPSDGAGIRLNSTNGTQTIRAIFDYTDRGGYLQREYGTLMRRELVNGGEPHWAGLSTGGDIPFTELTIGTSKKLKLHSYMKAFNNRAAGLAEVKEAYEQLSSLNLVFSETNSTANINAVMSATGMDKSEASSVYSSASNYAQVLADNSLADEIGTRASYANTSVSGVAITLPTLEFSTDFSRRSFSVEADGAYNDGAEYITISRTANSMAILSGAVEICTNR